MQVVTDNACHIYGSLQALPPQSTDNNCPGLCFHLKTAFSNIFHVIDLFLIEHENNDDKPKQQNENNNIRRKNNSNNKSKTDSTKNSN